MRNILMIAAGVMIVGGYITNAADKSIPKVDKAAAATGKSETAKRQQTKQARSGPQSMTLSSDRSGHFIAQALVQDKPVEFMVDTGASLVALRRSAAIAIGVEPKPGDYTAAVSTANGTVMAARVRLNEIAIGGITVYDINALVLPDKALGQNLLGVSFLSRLRRYEYANGQMVLEQ